MMIPHDAKEMHLDPRVVALVDLARRSLGAMSLPQRSRGLARYSARIAKVPGVRLSSWKIAALALGVITAVALAAQIRRPPPNPTALSYKVEGASHPEDGALGDAKSETNLRFSDGTEIQLGKGARAHVTSITESGATFALDQGGMRARVVHWAGSRWLFDAGPFVVTVTGTAFTLSWAPEEERFDLQLENGSVAVVSPTSNQPIALRSGQWLTISLRRGEVLIRNLAAGDSPPPVSSSNTAAAGSPAPLHSSGALESRLDADRPPSVEPSPTTAPLSTKRDWNGKLASGKLEEIVSEAEQWGIGACLQEATSSELSSLADAARYTKRAGLAKQTLLSERRRFAGSRRATEAAFLLGRLAESQEGPASALAWFEKYLQEAPSGAYASEALGRRMMLVEKTSGREQASFIAQEYLRTFPNGAYAGAARALLGAQ